MAQTQINITPFSGSEIDNFNEFEQITGVAGIEAAQQSNFLQLRLKRHFKIIFSVSRGHQTSFCRYYNSFKK